MSDSSTTAQPIGRMVAWTPKGPNPAGRRWALGGVLAVHAALGWLLISGTGQRLVEQVVVPVRLLLSDAAPPPPPPPPSTAIRPKAPEPVVKAPPPEPPPVPAPAPALPPIPAPAPAPPPIPVPAPAPPPTAPAPAPVSAPAAVTPPVISAPSPAATVPAANTAPAPRLAPANTAPVPSATPAPATPSGARAEVAAAPAKPPTASEGCESRVLSRPNFLPPDSALVTRDGMSTSYLLSIDRQGRPTGVKIQKTSGSLELDETGIDRLMRMRFAPCIRDGVAVPSEFAYNMAWARPK